MVQEANSDEEGGSSDELNNDNINEKSSSSSQNLNDSVNDFDPYTKDKSIKKMTDLLNESVITTAEPSVIISDGQSPPDNKWRLHHLIDMSLTDQLS